MSGERELVRLEVESGLAVMTLDSPPVNALNEALLQEVEKTLDRVEGTPSLRALIVTGAGKAFVAGADISRFPNLDPPEGVALSARGQALFDRLSRLEMPVIAAINGYALGGGLELALACDLRVAAANARMGLPEVGLGAMPGYGGTQRLPRLIGAGMAKMLIYSGEAITAEEAYRIGLVEVLAPEGEALKLARELAQKILTRAPLAVRQAKRVIDRGLAMSLEEGVVLEHELFGELAGTHDLKEGATAFLEKRPPRFEGK